MLILRGRISPYKRMPYISRFGKIQHIPVIFLLLQKIFCGEGEANPHLKMRSINH